MNIRGAVVLVAALLVAGGAVADDDADEKAVAKLKSADLAAKKGDFDAALAGYKEFLEHVPSLKAPDRARKSLGALAHFHISRLHARKGDKAQALAALEKAAEGGFRPSKQVAAEKSFAAFHEEESFKKALAKIEAVEKAEAANEPRIPGNPFAGAKEGDWSVYRGTIANQGREPMRTVLTFTVAKVADGKVTIDVAQKATGGKKAPAKTLTFGEKEEPTLRAFFEFTHGEAISAVKVEDAKKTVGDRTFECKKLAFDIFMTGATGGVELYHSSDVKGSGRVHVSMVLDNVLRVPNMVERVDYELAGFGPKGGKTWGVTPEKLAEE
jgi:hypothetical protein